MAEVSTEFTGDPKRLIAAYQAIQKENVKLRQEMTQLKMSFADVARGAEEGLGRVATISKSQVLAVGGWAAGLATISSLVGRVTEAYGKWNLEIQRLGKNADSVGASFTRMMSTQDDWLNAKDAASWLRTLPDVTREQGQAVLAGVSSAGRAPYERRKAISAQAARAIPLGLDAGQFGATTGAINEMLPGLHQADVADLAYLVQAESAGAAGAVGSPEIQSRVRELVKAGAPPEEALALALQAESKGFGSGYLKKAATALKSPKFQAMPADQRIAALGQLSRAEQQRIFGDQARAYDSLDFGEVAATAGRFREAFDDDVIGSRRRAQLQVEQGRRAAQVQADLARVDKENYAKEFQAQTRMSVEQFYERKANQNPAMRPITDPAFAGQLAALDATSSAGAGTRGLAALYLTLGKDAADQFAREYVASGGSPADAKQLLAEMLTELKTMNGRGGPGGRRGPVPEQQHGER